MRPALFTVTLHLSSSRCSLTCFRSSWTSRWSAMSRREHISHPRFFSLVVGSCRDCRPDTKRLEQVLREIIQIFFFFNLLTFKETHKMCPLGSDFDFKGQAQTQTYVCFPTHRNKFIPHKKKNIRSLTRNGNRKIKSIYFDHKAAFFYCYCNV